MKHLFFFSIFFFFSNLFSQTIEEIKKSDTVYIFFEKSENQILYISLRNNKISHRGYHFKGEGNDNLTFDYSEYGDFDHPNEKSGMDVKILKKRFLKKNIDKVIDMSFILKYGFKETFFALYNNKKKTYIIDKQEFKKNKIVVREVDITPNYIVE